MITGRWGKPAAVLLDLVTEPDGTVRGVANPGRHDAPIASGRFDAATGAVLLEGEHTPPDGRAIPFRIEGRLVRRTLRLNYQFGELRGSASLVRVEEYRPPRHTVLDRLKDRFADLQRAIFALGRPSGTENAQHLRARGESLDSITLREAVAADIPALAALHVELWNKTYRTTRGPTVATRAWQWRKLFEEGDPRDFTLVLGDRTGRLIGFVRARPSQGEFESEISKVYLRWEYHGLGLGRRMMREAARRLAELGMRSVVLHAERSNPTIGFYDRMGGERLVDEKGRFTGGFGWREVGTLVRGSG